MTLENIEFEMRLEQASLDHYRLDWTPSPDVRLSGMWVPGVVTDRSGRNYLGLRGFSDFIPGMTHTVSPFCGFRALERSLYDDPPHLYSEYSNHDWFEPLEYAETDDKVQFTYYSGRVERDEDGCHWHDADGRWEIHGTTVSKVFVVHVPEQEGIEREVYYRHELLKAHGTVSGEQVEGYLHQDYCYGPPGLTYTDLPIARQLEGMWVSWIHEYLDDEVGGGCFWQGRGGLSFGPGYLLDHGETTAHGDIEATLDFNDDQKPVGLHVEIGGQSFDFVLDTMAGPLHYFGQLERSSSGKQPARSWCWVEYAEGMMTPELLDMTSAPFRLVRAGQEMT
ncbi:MAG TPA: hypothetical protein VJM33_00090 [Microthrixaceae bacterium]|nr:hypothetical protein [Microthrixaceae bacterium]